jgi:hypothetical protein
MIMEENKAKSTEKESSSNAALQRGKEAILADDKINKKDRNDPEVKEQQAKDDEKWRNEG